ncbi:hypothetical protein L484_025709 [Morus notabilis]|uniref:Pentatricopeptide repeat-containing protein n=1 Tax=Morus notabilis TaxID=981085 RepID=W9REA2_9ROSA|nr:hypothetical protein L484_025709 [Morus notabilis]
MFQHRHLHFRSLSSAFPPLPLQQTQTHLIQCNNKIQQLAKLGEVQESMPDRSVISWNAMVSGYVQNGHLKRAREVFDEMPERNIALWNSMIMGYCRCDMMTKAHRNEYTWTTMITAFSQCGRLNNAILLYEGASEKGIHSLTIRTRCQFNLFVGNGLISMHGKCKNIEGMSQVFSIMRSRDYVSWNSLITGLPCNHMLKEARMIFDKMPKCDVVSLTSIVSAYEQAGEVDTAFKLFLEILARGTKPNELTIISPLSACGCLGATRLGEQIRVLIHKLGLNSCLDVCNALMTMYVKCGNLDGLYIFEKMPDRNIVTWNTVLAGCVENGLGRLTEAEALIENVPVKLDTAIWKALLATCRIHHDNKLSQRVAERVFKTETQRSGTYVLLSNMYASQGMWEKVREIRELMKDNGVVKEPAITWIQIKNKVHCFRMGDKAHFYFEDINTKLNDLYQSFKATAQDLYKMETDSTIFKMVFVPVGIIGDVGRSEILVLTEHETLYE